jgi:hypothetical protein
MTATGASLAGHAARLAAQADRVALCLDFDGTLSRSWTTRRRLGRYRASSSCTGPGRPIRRRRLISGRAATYLTEHAAAPSMRSLDL